MKKIIEKEVLRIGKWFHPKAPKGILEITGDFLQKVVDNFSITPFVPVLRSHIDNSEAEKKPELTISKNIQSLTTDGQKLTVKFEADESELDKYNDVSASIEPDYVNKETGKVIGPVLSHIAMVLNPYIKGMGEFTMLSDDDKNYLINLSEIKEMTDEQIPVKPEVEVTEVEVEKTDAEVVETEVEKEKSEVSEVPTEEAVKQAEAVETEIAPVETEKVEASEDAATQIKKLQAELEQARLELSSRTAMDKYTMLLSEGKILPAQKEAFIALHENVKGTIDLSEETINLADVLVSLFQNNPVLVNLSEKGVHEVDDDTSEETEVEAELRKLPVHAGKTDTEWTEYWNKFKQIAVADYKKSKTK